MSKHPTWITLFACLSIALSAPAASACTIFMATDGRLVLVGNNEDWMDPNGKIGFRPGADGKHGWIFFGHSDGYEQGGVNDAGLFFDHAALPPRAVKTSKKKKEPDCDLMAKMMEECATVEEALALLGGYNLRYMTKHQTLICDKTGDSAIIEGDAVVRKKGNHQVTTNFRQTGLLPGLFSCPRYRIADAMLQGVSKVSVESIRNVLAAVHQEGEFPTQYSNVYDLTHGDIYVYHYHNFTNVVKLNVKEELRKGKRMIDLPALFPTTYAATAFRHQHPLQTYSYLQRKAERDRASAEDLNDYAWALLTSEPEELRDPVMGLTCAMAAAHKSNGEEPAILDTLALAYARMGDIAKAIETQRKAVSLLPPGDSPLRQAIERQFEEFESARNDD